MPNTTTVSKTTDLDELRDQLSEAMKRETRDWGTLLGKYERDLLANAVLREVGPMLRELDEVRSDRERLSAQRAKASEIHSEWKLYDECGHDHKDGEPGVVEIEDVGLVCQDGHVYSICRECCTDGGDNQTQECVSEHVLPCWPCATHTALSEHDDHGQADGDTKPAARVPQPRDRVRQRAHHHRTGTVSGDRDGRVGRVRVRWDANPQVKMSVRIEDIEVIEPAPATAPTPSGQDVGGLVARAVKEFADATSEALLVQRDRVRNLRPGTRSYGLEEAARIVRSRAQAQSEAAV